MDVPILKKGVFHCTCGCAQVYPRFDGETVEGDTKLFFRCVLMQHEAGFPHLWLGIFTGPWFDDGRDCWVSVHLWSNGTGLVTRIEDFADTPWSEDDIWNCRPLNRSDVLGNEGALPWFIEFAQQVTTSYKPFGHFLISGAAT